MLGVEGGGVRAIPWQRLLAHDELLAVVHALAKGFAIITTSMRWRLLAIPALLVACRSSEVPAAPPPPSPVASADAAGSAPSSSAFWARFLGAAGAPGPEMLALCRTREPAGEVREVAPGVMLRRPSPGGCSLTIEEATARYEARAVLAGWSRFDRGSLLDTENRLTTSFEISRDRISVTWTPHVPLEAIHGTGGRLLVGFDVVRVVGKPTTALRDAVSPPFVVDADCTADGCAAYGPAAPGGAPVRIGYLRRGSSLMVTIATTRELVPRVHELVAATLGPGQPGTREDEQVHVKDGVRYTVRDTSSGRVDVLIDTP